MMNSLLLVLTGMLGSPSNPSPLVHTIPQETFQDPGAPLSIDGVGVPWAEFANWLIRLQGHNNLDAYVTDYLLRREFERLGLVVTDQEVSNRAQAEITKRVERTFEGDREAWLAELERLGQTEYSYLEERHGEIRDELRRDKLVQSRRVVGDAEVNTAWQEQYGPGGHSVHVSRLLLRIKTPAPAGGVTRDESQALGRKALEDARQRAQALYERIQKEGDFDALVAEFSEDFQTRKNGGLLPDPVIPKDWPGVDVEVLKSVQVGQLMEPFHSAGGFHIFKVNEVLITPLEKVEEKLRKALLERPAGQVEQSALIAELRSVASIELLGEVRREVTAQSPRFQKPVAMVDGQALLRGEFSRWLVAQRGTPLMRTFAQHRWAALQVQDSECNPTPLAIEQRMQLEIDDQIKAFFEGDREKWVEDLHKKGRDLPGFIHQAKIRIHHNLRSTCLILAQRVITPAMIEREWKTRYGENGQSLDVRLIVRDLPNPPEGTVTTEAELQTYIAEQSALAIEFLESLAERVLDGEDFGALARTHSHDVPTRSTGGRGEGRFRLHTWPEDLQEQLRNLRPGQVTQPMEMSFRFYLFELAGRVHVPLEEVTEELRRELQVRPPSSVEVAGFINGATRGLKIVALPPMTATRR